MDIFLIIMICFSAFLLSLSIFGILFVGTNANNYCNFNTETCVKTNIFGDEYVTERVTERPTIFKFWVGMFIVSALVLFTSFMLLMLILI